MQCFFFSHAKFFKFRRSCEYSFCLLPIVGWCKNFCSVSPKTYYDVLGINKTSKNKEIRNAYFKLCKKLHPDTKPGDDAQHMKFIELNKAYTVLINPNSRKSYDSYLSNPNSIKGAFVEKTSRKNYHGFYGTYPQYERHWYDKEEYYNQFHKTQAYSSVTTIPKVWIVCGCIVLMLIGSVLYYSAYSFNKNYVSRKADEKSRKISLQYNLDKDAIPLEPHEHVFIEDNEVPRSPKSRVTVVKEGSKALYSKPIDFCWTKRRYLFAILEPINQQIMGIVDFICIQIERFEAVCTLCMGWFLNF